MNNDIQIAQRELRSEQGSRIPVWKSSTVAETAGRESAKVKDEELVHEVRYR